MSVIIIAEAGVNHGGDLNTAKKLIDVAADAGADYVKFQTFRAEKSISVIAEKAVYQQNNTADKKETQLEMVKKLELPFEYHQLLIDYCLEREINFLSTGFDFESLIFLKKIGIKIAKIPSGEITNLPYLRKVAELFDEVVLSTGMSTMAEVSMAMGVLLKNGIKKENIIALHCNTEYPTPMKDVNLFAMVQIRNTLDVKVGYSDHTLGIEVPVAAVALGAVVIEKHFTLDRKMDGPDHAASLEPDELKAMIAAIRNIEKAISGNGKKEPSDSESKNILIARKSIFASRQIDAGEIFTQDNICCKRPAHGISPMKWDEVIGLKASRSFKEDELIVL